MSAPYEFWAVIDKGEVVAVTGIPSGGVHVRYLRADLTCGECRCLDDSEYWDKCPHEDVEKHSKACMAFQPKEG